MAVLFSALLVSCTPSKKFQFAVSIEDENGIPVTKANVQLVLFANEPPLTAVTDNLGFCYFDVDRTYLKRLATIKVFCSGNPQPYTQTVSLNEGARQTIQVKSSTCSFATPTATYTPLATTATATITETPPLLPSTATFTPTSTSTPTIILTSTPQLPIATIAGGISTFTPYPGSTGIISPDTRNYLSSLTTWRTESAVYSLSISSDGKLVASGEQNGKVVVRDISTGTPLYMLDYGSAVLAVAFSPDGQWLAAAGSGRNILAWNTKSWNSPVEIGQHNGKVTSLSFSPDSTLLASSGYEDKSVKVWQVGSWTLNPSITVPDKVNAAVFSHDSKWIAVIANDVYPRVWDRHGKFQYELDSNVGPRQSIISVAFSPDSSLLVTGTRDLERCLQIWDTKSQKLKRGIGGNIQIDAIAFSPSGELLVTANSNKNNQFNITIWRASTVSELRTLENSHQDVIHSIVFTPDGRLMLTASRDHTIRVWGIR